MVQGQVPRRCVDPTAPLLEFLENRLRYSPGDGPQLQPTLAGSLNIPAPAALPHKPASCFATKLLHTSINRVKCAVNAVVWTPDARRCITGSQGGEFTLWNGNSYYFENIVQVRTALLRVPCFGARRHLQRPGFIRPCLQLYMVPGRIESVHSHLWLCVQGHEQPIRCMTFGNTGFYLLSSSDDGRVKIWLSSLTLLKALPAHKVRQLKFKFQILTPTLLLAVSLELLSTLDLPTLLASRSLYLQAPVPQEPCRSVSSSPNDLKFATCSDDSTIKLWGFERDVADVTMLGHGGDVKDVQWHPTQVSPQPEP